jgi:peptide methionine sulfoxide reductase MsrA
MNEAKQSQLIEMGCVWGIEKFFDEKQCIKNFKKNFKVFSEEDKNSNIKVEGLWKGKNRNFYVVKFA